MDRLVLNAIGYANLSSPTMSADDVCCQPWALFYAAGWISTAAAEAVR